MLTQPIPQYELYQELLTRIQTGWSSLTDKPEETPESTLRALWHLAAGQPMPVTHACDAALPPLTPDQADHLHRVVEQRMSGVPLAYLTGRTSFLGIELLCSPEAMIPRQETEILGRAALDTLGQIAHKLPGTIRVADLCTGSGNLALALAMRQPRCQVWGVDLSHEAVALAQRNATWLRAAERVTFLQGDLFAPFEQQAFLSGLDLITCNPPYISSTGVDRLPAEIQGYEPRLAFDGGAFGVQVVTRLVREAPRFLKPGGWLCFEVGLGQGRQIAHLLQKDARYGPHETFLDPQGQIRALRAPLVA